MHSSLKMIAIPFSICLAIMIANTNTFAADTSSTSVFANMPTNSTTPIANKAIVNKTNLPTPNAAAIPNLKPSKIVTPPPPAIAANGYILVDVYSGKVLAGENPDQRMEPASLTKLMTLYIIFEALKEGRIHLTDHVTVSENAWRTGGSRMFAQVGTSPTVEQLIQGIIVQSGNDACVAMAEYIAGTEDSFVNLMNQQASLLHMNNTHYTDSTGMPHPLHYSTPRDLSVLARSIILNFPEYYHYFGEKEFTYNNIKQPNRNRLLWRDPSVDGLKTGHTSTAGYCLIASAQRNGTRMLSVLLGAPSDSARAADSQSLLEYGFRFFESHKLYAANKTITQSRVWYGDENELNIGVLDDLFVTVTPGQFSNIQVVTNIDPTLKAPITKGQTVGNINVTLDGQTISSTPLIALQDIGKANIFVRMIEHIKYLFHDFIH